MLVACRLAGLSALGVYYAGGVTLMQLPRDDAARRVANALLYRLALRPRLPACNTSAVNPLSGLAI
jgi:hypothetical protein